MALNEIDVVLVVVVAVEQAVAGKEGERSYKDCHRNEDNYGHCCNVFRSDWKPRLTRRIWRRNICECISPGGDRTERMFRL